VGEQTRAELIVAAARDLAPNLPIIARASTESGVTRLAHRGADHVIHPELEGGLEIVGHTLLSLHYPTAQIQQYVDSVRREAYAATSPNDNGSGGERKHVLDQLLTALQNVEIAWLSVSPQSSVLGRTLAEANLRARTGASAVALIRDEQVLPNPKSDTKLLGSDIIGFIGEEHELALVKNILNP
jgi:CPA2 family monovalent cation:H+ antiporter-2